MIPKDTLSYSLEAFFAPKREKRRTDVTRNVTAIPACKMRVWYYTTQKRTAWIRFYHADDARTHTSHLLYLFYHKEKYLTFASNSVCIFDLKYNQPVVN